MKKFMRFAANFMIALGLLICLSVGNSSAQSNYEVNKSKDTVHNTPPPKQQPKSEPIIRPKEKDKTILVPAGGPFGEVPMRVPADTPEKHYPHALENESPSVK
jgi:hypothetical protein